MAAEYVLRMGRRIAEARDEAGMSQNDLARALPGKVGAQMVSKWERGLHEPRADTLESLARVLNKPVAYFMAEEPLPGTPDLMRALDGDSQLDRLEAKLDRILEHVSEEAVNAALAGLRGQLAHVTAELEALRLDQAAADLEALARHEAAMSELAQLRSRRPA